MVGYCQNSPKTQSLPPGLPVNIPDTGDFRRSDHDPFWQEGIPAVMWTDTAEFRNPNYHEPGNTPDTLDYGFLRRVAQLVTACAMSQF
jgi:hypothetical protein